MNRLRGRQLSKKQKAFVLNMLQDPNVIPLKEQVKKFNEKFPYKKMKKELYHEYIFFGLGYKFTTNRMKIQYDPNLSRSKLDLILYHMNCGYEVVFIDIFGIGYDSFT